MGFIGMEFLCSKGALRPCHFGQVLSEKQSTSGGRRGQTSAQLCLRCLASHMAAMAQSMSVVCLYFKLLSICGFQASDMRPSTRYIIR